MPDSNKQRRSPSDLISASELACYAYCPEQWRLQYGLGLPTRNQKSMDAGTRHHHRKASAERLAAGLLTLGRGIAVVVVCGLLWLLWRHQ